MAVTISKTDFLLYRECRKNSWLKIHKPEIYYKNELSAFEKSIIETGNEVESVARGLFPTGVLVEGRDERSRDETARLIAIGEKTVFQPVFEKDGFLAAVDILRLDESGGYSIYEIKASNQIKEGLHLSDLAFQVNLLKMCGLKVNRMSLLHLNPDYVRQDGLDLAKLFRIDDVTEGISAMLSAIEAEMGEAKRYLSQDKEPNGPCQCVYKGRSGHCTTFNYSNPQIPEYGVHDIARIGLSKRKLLELIDGNVFDLEDIPESFELSEIQRNQVNVHISKRPIVKADKIAEEFRSLVFPLHFLDYETFPCAIPRFDGYSPYEQIPFQFSLHVVDLPGGEPRHFEFLHEKDGDPGRAFVEALIRSIGKLGTVIVWNKKFECGRNEELARRIPEARAFLEDLNSRAYDLMDIFSKQYHVHHGYRGSTSIKYVLPVLVPDLKYDGLTIREGGMAAESWNRLVAGKIRDDERHRIATDLKEYCKLDTYAMYSIWKQLNGLIS